MTPLMLDGMEIVPDEPRSGPQYVLVGPVVYEMFKLASDPAFWLIDRRKRKRLWRKAREQAKRAHPAPD